MIVPVNVLTISEDIRILQVLQRVPAAVAQDARVVDQGWRDYQELTLARVGLKRIFGLTLTLAMLLTLFSSIALAFLLSERLSAPLSALAEATRAIAKGDYSRLNPVRSRDEFGVLTQSFNTMTRQIADATEAMERNQQQLENAKTYLESILSNLTSGVLTFDERHYLKTVNATAYEILGVPGRRLPRPEAAGLDDARGGRVAVRRDRAQAFLLRGEPPVGSSSSNTAATTARARCWCAARASPRAAIRVTSWCSTTSRTLLQAQRDAAWGEVARRLAHEIKNPLTPIQLSAERLQHKLQQKLP